MFLGVGASALGNFSWAFALSRIDVSRAASALYTGPLVTIAVGYVWLGEVPPIASVVGGLIAIVGVIVTNTRGRVPAKQGTAPAHD